MPWPGGAIFGCHQFQGVAQEFFQRGRSLGTQRFQLRIQLFSNAKHGPTLPLRSSAGKSDILVHDDLRSWDSPATKPAMKPDERIKAVDACFLIQPSARHSRAWFTPLKAGANERGNEFFRAPG